MSDAGAAATMPQELDELPPAVAAFLDPAPPPAPSRWSSADRLHVEWLIRKARLFAEAGFDHSVPLDFPLWEYANWSAAAEAAWCVLAPEFTPDAPDVAWTLFRGAFSARLEQLYGDEDPPGASQ